MSSALVHQHGFESMGTDIEVLLIGGSVAAAANAFAQAESLANEWMLTFSRFRADSELSRLNAHCELPVSERLFDAIKLAIEAARSSNGAFNPLVLPALSAVGYDRSFEHLATRVAQNRQSVGIPDAGQMTIDASSRRVRLPEGAGLDLGGIAKGLYADELMQRLSGWPGGIISAGGDMRIWGEGPDNGGWAVGIEPPDTSDHDIGVILIREGGIATSGTNRRTWLADDDRMHHIIDPRTGSPAECANASVTVIAPTATAAEIASTAMFVDPSLHSDAGLTDGIWATVTVDHQNRHILTRFNPEAPFDVYFSG